MSLRRTHPFGRTLRAVLLAFLAGSWANAQEAEAPAPIIIGVVLPTADGATNGEVLQASLNGLEMVADEFGFNAEILGLELSVLIERADGEAEVRAAVERLVDGEGVFALIGGHGGQAPLLNDLAAEWRLPFLNVGDPSDALRNERCSRYTFHIEPSAAMYLDSLAGWFVRAGFRRWFFVHRDDPEREENYRRAAWSLRVRHFGARDVGRSVVAPGSEDFSQAIAAARRANAEVVLLLLEPEGQLAFLEQAEAAGLEAQVTGFPDPGAQTRGFYLDSLAAAPTLGDAFRASAWESTLDAYGARELNTRYRQRFATPMTAAAWSSYLAVKILFESATFGPGLAADQVLAYFENPTTVFDLWKGIGTSFRPWDHQLRQSIYLVDIRGDGTDEVDIVFLVGELPAIYMPATDPIERLDQIGDLDRETTCRW
jgi:ABC-type branched-subunit amino acid transport system substrate-binding protein